MVIHGPGAEYFTHGKNKDWKDYFPIRLKYLAFGRVSRKEVTPLQGQVWTRS
jgi:hypothetical protein